MGMLGLILLGAAAASVPIAPGIIFVPGGFEAGRSPDGNSVLLDAPEGLIVVDTGRHPSHQAKLLEAARTARKPIAAIVNTHWHLDHNGGNAELLAEYPRAKTYGSNAIDGALIGFFPKSRGQAEQFLESGQASAEQEAELRGDFAAMDEPAKLRPTEPIVKSGRVRIAGRRLQVNLAPFAATEGDIWILDENAGLLIAGDLVVGLAPFMDTACPDGWRKALDQIAATQFTTLIPGHGAPMDRSRFLLWRTAFNNLLDCAASPQAKEVCVAGWKKDAAPFIAESGREADAMIGYYLDSRLRASPAERIRYCKPLR